MLAYVRGSNVDGMCVYVVYQQVGASLGVAILAVALGCTVSVDRILMTAGGAPLVIIGAATALTFLYPRPNKVCQPLGNALCPAGLSPLCPRILSSPILSRRLSSSLVLTRPHPSSPVLTRPLPSCQTLLLFAHCTVPVCCCHNSG